MNSCSNPTNGGIRSKAQALRNITSTKTGVGSTNPAPLSLCKMEESKNVIEFTYALGIRSTIGETHRKIVHESPVPKENCYHTYSAASQYRRHNCLVLPKILLLTGWGGIRTPRIDLSSSVSASLLANNSLK
jgi:hypothetical protein